MASIERVKLVTTLPKTLAGWRPRLAEGLRLAETRPDAWRVFDLYPKGDNQKYNFMLTPQLEDAIQRATLMWGKPVHDLTLRVTRAEAAEIARRFSIRPVDGFPHLQCLAVPKRLDPDQVNDLLRIAVHHGYAADKELARSPSLASALVIPLTRNRVVTAALHCVAAAPIPAPAPADAPMPAPAPGDAAAA